MRREGEIVDLSQVIVEGGEPGFYMDSAHLGPLGNDLVAEEIRAYLPRETNRAE